MDLKKPFHLANKRLKAFKRRRKPAAVILMYHRISDVALEPNWLAVSPRNFAQHLEHIRQAYHPIRLLDLVDAIQSRSIPRRAVTVTFDDGYRDNFTQALPLLETAQIPATVFVTAGSIGSTKEFWWDELSRMILAPPNVPPTLSLQIQGRHSTWNTASPEQRQAAYSALKEVTKPLPAATQDNILTDLARWSGLKRELRDDYRTMTAAELQQLVQSDYIDLGAHTMTHPLLPTLSPEAQYSEIVNSSRCLEALVNQPISTFAYPNGDSNGETLKIVEEAGFRAACTTLPGCVHSDDNLFLLRRCGVNDWGIETFKRNLATFFYGND